LADPAIGEALAALKQAGKARHVGVSCDDVGSVTAALAMPGVTLLELPFDLLGHAVEAARRGIAVLAREVVVLQPVLSPADAIRSAAALPGVSCTLVGTTRLTNLRAAVEALA